MRLKAELIILMKAELIILRIPTRSVFVMALLVCPLSSFVLGGCVGCQAPSGDPRQLVPHGANGVLVVPTLDTWREGAASFLSGIEGASGVMDLVHARTGLDLATPKGPSQAGIDPEGAVVISWVGSQLIVGLSVSEPQRFNRWLSAQSARYTAAKAESKSSQYGAVHVVAGPPLEGATELPQWRLAWGTTSDAAVVPNVGLVVIGGPFSDPGSLWSQVSSGPGGGLQTLASAQRGRQALGQANGVWGSWESTPWMPRGMEAKGVLAIIAPFYPALMSWSLWGQWEKARLVLHAKGHWSGSKAMHQGWFGTSSAKPALAQLFPKNLTAWTRIHLDMKRVAKLPTFLKKRMGSLPLPQTWKTIIPDLPAAIGELSGDFSLAILGLDPDFRLDELKRRADSLEGLLQLIHCAVAFRVKSMPAFHTLLNRAQQAFEQRGWSVSTIRNGALSGRTFSEAASGQTWSVLLRDDLAVVISGKGEVGRFLEANAGTSLPLSEAGTTEMAKAALMSEGLNIGGFAGFTRITRELADKGFPPYFLKVINDIRSVSLSVEISEDGMAMSLEISL